MTTTALSDTALDQLFRSARSTHAFSPEPVTEKTVRQIYELIKWGPTAFNAQPGRYVFIRSADAKARLAPALLSSNNAKTMAAPLTVIVAHDTRFFEHLADGPPSGAAKELLGKDPSLAQVTALRNSSLQGAYLILAARALGLVAGPMSGFNAELLDRAFFADSPWRSNFLINLGYSDGSEPRPRALRLPFEDTVRLL